MKEFALVLTLFQARSREIPIPKAHWNGAGISLLEGVWGWEIPKMSRPNATNLYRKKTNFQKHGLRSAIIPFSSLDIYFTSLEIVNATKIQWGFEKWTSFGTTFIGETTLFYVSLWGEPRRTDVYVIRAATILKDGGARPLVQKTVRYGLTHRHKKGLSDHPSLKRGVKARKCVVNSDGCFNFHNLVHVTLLTTK